MMGFKNHVCLDVNATKLYERAPFLYHTVRAQRRLEESPDVPLPIRLDASEPS
jgi:hypothetical protein